MALRPRDRMKTFDCLHRTAAVKERTFLPGFSADVFNCVTIGQPSRS
jgi:hypothetical protein